MRDVDGLPTGKMPLRDLYDLYPDELPTSIRDRTKVPFGEGAGLDVTPAGLGLEAPLRCGDLRRRFRATARRNSPPSTCSPRKSSITCASSPRVIDVTRVPHLRDRAWISFPVAQHREKLKAYANYSL